MLGGRTIGLFVLMVFVVCVCTALTAPPLLQLLELDAASAASLRATTTAASARACAPAQVVGFSTRSSLASLPATIAASENLGLSPGVSGLVLPFAVSLFKFASPVGRASGTYFIARLYGIELGPAEIAVIAAAIGLLSFYSPGVPSGGLLIMTPLYAALNLPVEGIGILIALDLLVDMTITPTNVTANLTVAAMLTRSDRN